MVKSVESVRSANTREGIIHSNMKDCSHIRIESPDGLFKLGVDEVKFEELGIKNLEF